MPSSLKRRRQRESQRVQIAETIQQRIEFSGPIPPPAVLKQYEEISPGSADRILSMAEKEQHHRHRLENTVAVDDTMLSRLGMRFAFAITMTSLSAATWLGFLGHEIAGSAIGACGITLIVARFLSRPRPEN